MAKDVMIDLFKLSVFKNKIITLLNQHNSNQNIHMSDNDHTKISTAYNHAQLLHAPTNIATDLDSGLMSAEDKIKLDSISNNANYYIHPNTHDVGMIVTDDNHQFVSKGDKQNWDSIYQQSTEYTNQKIFDLINGAPTTLDTLGEIAQAMSTNTDVVNALNQSIGNKADSLELDGHTGNSTIHITASERTNWNKKMDTTGNASNTTAAFTQASTLANISTGEKISAIMGKISKAIATLISHVSEKATSSVFGHVKLSDTYKSAISNGAAANGVGASQKALADAYSALNSCLGNCTFSVQSDGAYVIYTPKGGADAVTKKLGSMDLKSTKYIKETGHYGTAYFDVTGIDSITVTVQQTDKSTTSLYICGGDNTDFDTNNNEIKGVVLETLASGVTNTIDCSGYDYVAMEFYNSGISINRRYSAAGICIVNGAQCVKAT